MKKPEREVAIDAAQHFRTDAEARSWARRVGLKGYRIETHRRPGDRDADAFGNVHVLRLKRNGAGFLQVPRPYA